MRRNLTTTAITEEISFLSNSNSYCVCFVDMIDSTKIIAQIAIPDKVRKYYSIFLNSMSALIKKFGGSIIKNLGDSLVFYFPKTCNSANRSAFRDVLECGITMMAAFKVINSKMSQMQLPNVNYRISADYGSSVIAKSANSQAYDLYGHTMNICAKINSKAPPNGMVIGDDLYGILSSFSSPSFFDDYYFKRIGEYLVDGLEQPYLLYSVVSKYENENITIQQQQQRLEDSQLQQEHYQKQEEEEGLQKNILLVDDEPDVVLTYKSILVEEGYNVNAYTDPREALRHFAQLDPLYYKLILLDIRMPNLNGFQLYYRLKAISPNIRVLFVSALDAAQEMVSILPDVKLDDIVSKPIDNEQFLRKVKMTLAA
jgi:two-component system, OmpR family, response regulator ChvI